jgi:hypothetical protein
LHQHCPGQDATWQWPCGSFRECNHRHRNPTLWTSICGWCQYD